jgi:hypothetical protein
LPLTFREEGISCRLEPCDDSVIIALKLKDTFGLALKLTIEPTNSEDTAEISLSVQNRGYTGWFAVPQKDVEAALALVRKWIINAIKATAQKAGA